jgi:broad specificity phosphatase PhoE
MTTVILIRHGQSVANLNRIFAGHFNADLSELGHKQAECTANAIFERFKVDKIYSSDLKRAYDTARHVAEKFGLAVIPDEAFREIYAGEWEGMYIEDLGKKFTEDYSVWQNDIGNSRCTGGESMREVGQRFLKRLKEIVAENPDKTLVVATHAAAIRSLQCTVPNERYDEMQNIPFVSNASYSVLEADEGRFEFVEVCCDRHIGELVTRIMV